jgi:chemotaxis protein MotB
MSSSKFNPPHEEHSEESDEIWLISYADLMTLLFCFFVLMYVFAIKDSKGQVQIKQELVKYFGGTYAPPYKELRDSVSSSAKQFPFLENAIVAEDIDGVEITFRSALLFEVGQTELVGQAKEAIEVLTKILKIQSPNARVLVAGHTDDAPISTERFPSNWELSSARAATVVRIFIESGMSPSQLAAIGYAESRPAFPNKNKDGRVIEENRNMNRRVVIKVIPPQVAPTDEQEGFTSATE